MTIILDGKAVAACAEGELASRVSAFKTLHNHVPVLATILVGSDPSSATYVKMKGNACRRVGMESKAIELPESSMTSDVLAVIDALNANPHVQGILLQHPVPKQIDERACFDRISISKDVDGVTSHGFGLMVLGESGLSIPPPGSGAAASSQLRRSQTCKLNG